MNSGGRKRNWIPYLLAVAVSALATFYALTSHAADFRVALLLDKGGKDDKSFNAAAFRGATDAEKKLGIHLKTIEASDDSFFEPAMRSFIAKKYDLIIAIGVAQAETVRKLSKENPDQRFAIIDAPVDGSNIVSALFEEQEGSYLAGYAAALKSKTGAVGFIGGMDIPLIRRFEKAYAQGAQAARKNIRVFVNYVGVTSDAWNNPTKAKELAQNQYQRGADVIFSAAGASNMGAFDSAGESQGRFAIGCDSNQNWIKPGRILTSMLKRVDTAVFQIISDLKEGKFKSGTRHFGLSNGGIDLAFDAHNEPLFSKDELGKLQSLKQSIAAGKVSVVDYYKVARK